MFNSLLASSFWQDMTNYFANFDGTTNICRTVFLWIALAAVIAFAVCKFAVKKDRQPLVNLVFLIIAAVVGVACIVTFVVCNFIDDKEYFVAITFYPLLVFAIYCVVGGLAIAVFPKTPVKISVASVICASFVAAFVCMVVYYASGDAAAHNYVDKAAINSVGLYIAAAALAAGIIVLAFLADRSRRPFDSRTISFAAICIALSFALSFIRPVKMPMGGSITLASTLPIMLFSYMYGSKKGLLAGVIYGALQAIQDCWIIHPAQFILDYGVAFAGIGVAGCIKDFGLFKGKARAQFALGAVIAGVLRFISHYFSGVFAFGQYGAVYASKYGISALSSPWVYSLVYQCLYVIPDLLISLVAGVILFSSRSFEKQLERYTNAKTAKPQPRDNGKLPETAAE